MQLKGADPAGLNRLVYGHAGPNPPVPPLSPEAEALKEEGNALFKAGDFDAAREKYSAALEQAVSSARPEIVLVSFRSCPETSLAHTHAPEFLRLVVSARSFHPPRKPSLLYTAFHLSRL